MNSNYSHYCPKCRKYYSCTHDDPEKIAAYGPCGHRLALMFESLEKLKVSIRLRETEIGQGRVSYR
jgi:hypothetical protein